MPVHATSLSEQSMNTRRVSVLWRIVLITAMIWSPAHGADNVGSVRLAANEADQPVYVSPSTWGNQPMGDGSAGLASVGSSSSNDPFGIQFRFRTDIGEGFYNDGFQTLGVMVPFHLDPGTSLFFAEARGYATNNSNYGGNVGGGYRYYDIAQNRMHSLSGWYDYDDSNVNNFERWGLSSGRLRHTGQSANIG